MKTRVKMLVSIAGNADATYGQPEFSYRIGEFVEVHPQLAAEWISAGLAEALNDAAPASLSLDGGDASPLMPTKFDGNR